MRKLIATSIAVLCAGCAPWPTTDRPNITFQVNDQDGAPIQGALIQFATYSLGMSPRNELHELHTNEEGRVSVPGEWHWQLVILAADGATFYDWAYCVEKKGFAPVENNSLKSSGVKSLETVRLVPSAVEAHCEWKGTGGYQSKFEIVGSNKSPQSDGFAPAGLNRYTPG